MTGPLHVVVSCAENRVMGRRGGLPWHIPEDLRQFHALTAGQIVIIGRVGFGSWPQAAAEGRRPIVVTSRGGLPGVPTAPSFPRALALAETLPGEVFVCGGERIYAEALAAARPLRLHLTLIHAEVQGDRHFPEWRHLAWREIGRREGADANFRYTFLTLER